MSYSVHLKSLNPLASRAQRVAHFTLSSMEENHNCQPDLVLYLFNIMHLLKLSPGDISTEKVCLKSPSTTKTRTALPTFLPTTLHCKCQSEVVCVHILNYFLFWHFTRTSLAPVSFPSFSTVLESIKHLIYVPECVLSCVLFLATPQTVVHQVLLSMGFYWQEYWNGLPFPPPGYLPDPEIEPASLASPALTGGFFTTVPPGRPL